MQLNAHKYAIKSSIFFRLNKIYDECQKFDFLCIFSFVFSINSIVNYIRLWITRECPFFIGSDFKVFDLILYMAWAEFQDLSNLNKEKQLLLLPAMF